jgi:hypothetical protein
MKLSDAERAIMRIANSEKTEGRFSCSKQFMYTCPEAPKYSNQRQLRSGSRRRARSASPIGLKVEFQFDFRSPNAYLAEYRIPPIERRAGVKFDYVPVLLGGIYKATGNMSPFNSLRAIKNKPEY